MPQNIQTILYKNFQIDIAAESLASGKWRPQWWIWISDEATRFFEDSEFDSEEEANKRAEISAKQYIDTQA